LASPDTKLGLPEIGLGIIPAAGGTQTLPRVIGRSRALEMLLTNRWISAEEALQFQLINRIIPREELVNISEEMARKIASYDPSAVKYAKQAVVRGMDMNLMEGLNLEGILAAGLRKERAQKDEKTK
jgi:enoyl-CoA hydratase